jgi:hypothetical protein
MTLKFNKHGYPYEDRGDLDLTLQIEKLQKEIKLLRQNRSLDTMDEVAYRELQAENEKLKADLARAKEDHQYDNLVHQKELEKILKKF